MHRKEIVQRLLKTYENRTYLEIGIVEGRNFVGIQANNKVGVDIISPSELADYDVFKEHESINL
jgi:hypothetical protein